MTRQHNAAPFDPLDPHDAAAEDLRKRIAQAVMDAHATPLFRQLNEKDHLSLTVVAGLTGIVGCALSMVCPAHRDVVMASMVDFLPTARELAEGIIAGGSNAH